MKVNGCYVLRKLESLVLMRLFPRGIGPDIQINKRTMKEDLEILQVRCQDTREPWLYWSQ